MSCRSTLVRALSVAALVALTAGCASSPPGESGASGDAWQAIAAPPFAPRTGAVTAWTGTEALFLGGDTSPPCPPNASCVGAPDEATDGAAYDPVAGTWRPTAPAPQPILAFSPHALVGGTLYLWGRTGLLAYDAAADAWRTAAAPAGLVGADLAPLDDRIVAVVGERARGEPSGEVFDPATRRWTRLPADPLGPAFGRGVTAIVHGVVLTGHDLVPQPGADGPSVERAAVLDARTMTWRLLPDSDQLGNGAWSWTGARLVMPALGGADGGAVGGYGRTVPYGGTLDPATGIWGRLPHPPKLTYRGSWPVYAPGGARYATEGWVYEDAARSWTKLTRPSGAPEQPGDAVWAGRRLIVVGGVGGVTGERTRSAGAWLLTLPD